MRLARPRLTVNQLLRQIRRADVESAALMLNFESQTALMICNGRDEKLLQLLDAVIAGEALDATAAGLLASAPAVAFAPIEGMQARAINLTGRREMQAGDWIARSLKSGAFGRSLRGITSLVVERSGRVNAVNVGYTLQPVPILVAVRESLRALRSRSNRGRLKGPYWYRAHGPGAQELAKVSDPPSALLSLFAEDRPGATASAERT